MPEIKLTYFDIRARGELPRLAFAIADMPYTDERISFSNWMELKPKMPYQSLPVLTVDGKVVAGQSYAINNYVGKITGLYPKNEFQAMQVDEIQLALEDFLKAARKYRGNDREKLKEQREAFVAHDIARYYGGLEKRLEYFGEGPYAVGNSLTTADLAIFCASTTIKSGLLDFIPLDVLDKYPRAMAIYNLVLEHPKVAAWYKKYPVDFVKPNMEL